MTSKLPELINLNDSVASLTDFLKKIPEEVNTSFDYKIPNGIILDEIITQLIKNPKKQEDHKIVFNDSGYQNIQTIQSILGIEFQVTKDIDELLNEQTQVYLDQFLTTLPKEKESQSNSIATVQINELENAKLVHQKDIIQLTGLQSKLHKQDVRQELVEQLLESKKFNIRITQQSINLFNDQLMFRNLFQQFRQQFEELIYCILKLETTLTFRTQKLKLELQMSQNEREKLQIKEIEKLKSIIKEKDEQLIDITNKIQFNVTHYQKLEEQIQVAKQNIQKQLASIKQQKQQKEDKQKTSSPSALSASKSNISDLEILKQQTRKVSNSYAHRNRFKTVFFKR
ncbi:unnamed protein product (macronuclear) [Paramecium tetraurelia]|uniref:Uncharacterized protein n=1 Tax=Paramecium tetraurelia TaxID=5888 RepID=A0DIT2_PARTE|nr:uncharacterized protein GSPATT00017306001 [Paramecium tetraurelia]CAK82949.1 unnamed protein product [Paramecium tetraurelia]|eukprot:XP_001450346.1 hypothetical protein (macronuclear) [Paramecium tetraurelia strain d4-2]